MPKKIHRNYRVPYLKFSFYIARAGLLRSRTKAGLLRIKAKTRLRVGGLKVGVVAYLSFFNAFLH